VKDVPTPLEQIGTGKRPDAALRRLLRDVIKHCPKKSRANIADEMSALVGVKLSKRQIDDWIGPKKRARFPAFLIESFCKATGNNQLQRFGMDEQSRQLLDLAEALLKMDWDEPLLKLGQETERLRAQVLALKQKTSRKIERSKRMSQR
jgi:hypothetical protein